MAFRYGAITAALEAVLPWSQQAQTQQTGKLKLSWEAF